MSLMCSVPYFNALTPEEIMKLVVLSQRETLRPGESKALACADSSSSPAMATATTRQDGQFYIVISGTLALARAEAENAKAVKQAELLPSMKLGIGDFFAVHSAASAMKVIAMEPVECLVVPMHAIAEFHPELSQQIRAETNDMACEASEVRPLIFCRIRALQTSLMSCALLSLLLLLLWDA